MSNDPSLNPMLMFHVNLMNALANLNEKQAVPFQVLSFPGSSDASRDLAYETLNKTNRAVEMILNDLERRLSPGQGRPVLSLVKRPEDAVKPLEEDKGS